MNFSENYKSLRINNCLDSPISLQIEIINKCPLNCKQCYKDLYKESEMDYEIFSK